MDQLQSQSQSQIYQIITKLINGKSQTLNFKTPIIPISQIKSQIQTLTSIPIHHQLLISNGKTLQDDVVLHHETNSPTLHLLLRLRGGKGGFGSLLRGAATKAGQKKTNNFDACRDMSGRRLRHVNAEKKMEEWLAEETERKLEKVAEDFIKKQSKLAKKAGGGNGDGAEKYVEKYRNDSRKCMEDVEKSVRESLSSGFLKSKRKVEEGNGSVSKSKKLKIWMGKRKVDDSDSDDMGEEDSDDEEMADELDQSGVTNNENRSDSHKDADGSLASVNGGKVEGESSVGCSSESASEEEKENVAEERLGSVEESKDEVSLHEEADAPVVHEESIMNNLNDSVSLEMEKFTKPEFNDSEQKQCKLTSISDGQEAGTNDVEVENSDSKIVDEEKLSTRSDCPEPEKPLNFDEFNSAAEIEVLGMERLKSELQERGLKCGGTLQERAARLFLLKTTPLEMLPKKLLAKK
uniref:replication stress response regulator SDE2 n=1 Tax=Erigeron canadensis TaxID=72917 RepID=UPI001CB8E058|nr:replication stress response regulator SDE2 [Erigeron canadensis]